MNDSERLNLTSASNFADDFACLGRRNFINSLPPLNAPIEDPDTGYGNAVHEALETGNILKLDEEQLETYSAIMAQEEFILNKWTQDNNLEVISKWGREERLWINGDDFEPLTSAKLDRYWLSPPFALIEDVKSLYAPRLPRANDSWQLKVQAVCLWLEYGCDQIRVSYNCPNKFGRKFDVADFNRYDLVRFLGEIKHIVSLIMRPDAPRTPGDQCRWCEGKAFCPEALSMSLLPSVVAQASRGMDKANIEAKVATLGVPDLVYLWQRQSIVKNVLEAVAARLRGTSEVVLTEYGIRLAPGKDTSYVAGKDIKAMCEALVAYGLPEDAIWQCLSLDTAALNDLILMERGGTKKAATELAKQLVTPFKTEDRGEKRLMEI